MSNIMKLFYFIFHENTLISTLDFLAKALYIFQM